MAVTWLSRHLAPAMSLSKRMNAACRNQHPWRRTAAWRHMDASGEAALLSGVAHNSKTPPATQSTTASTRISCVRISTALPLRWKANKTPSAKNARAVAPAHAPGGTTRFPLLSNASSRSSSTPARANAAYINACCQLLRFSELMLLSESSILCQCPVLMYSSPRMPTVGRTTLRMGSILLAR